MHYWQTSLPDCIIIKDTLSLKEPINNMSFYLKIAFVVVLCLPIIYLGYRFISSLIDDVIAGKKKRRTK